MIQLSIPDGDVVFSPCSLEFTSRNIQNVFAKKNNKTLQQTIEHSRYSKLADTVLSEYTQYLSMPLGDFLMVLKNNGDLFYKCFLNQYGDSPFCSFRITDQKLARLRGIYAYTSNDQLVYIGRCREYFGKRISHGYGKISPKKCFLDGRNTECHLNGLINSCTERIALYIAPMDDEAQIIYIERVLIEKYKPL